MISEFDKRIKEIREDRPASGWRNGALMGMREGRELTLKEVEKVLEDVRNECKDTMTFSHLDFVIDVIKKKLGIKNDIR